MATLHLIDLDDSTAANLRRAGWTIKSPLFIGTRVVFPAYRKEPHA